MIGSSSALSLFIRSGLPPRSSPCPWPHGSTATDRDSRKAKKGQAKAKKPKADPNHRTRPELAVELIKLAASWFPDDTIIVTGDSAYGGKSVLGHLPENVHLISHVHPKGALYEPAPQPDPNTKTKGRPRKKGARLPGMAAWAEDPKQPWTELKFHQFGLHATLAVKTIQALYYKSGGDRLLTIVLVRDLRGGPARPDVLLHQARLGRTTDPLDLRLSLGDRMHL